MPCYLTPKQDDFDKIPELQVCIAEALYDAEAVLSNPAAFKAEEIRTLRDQITSNLERAWEITGGSEDKLKGTTGKLARWWRSSLRKTRNAPDICILSVILRTLGWHA
jgi:ElaB/YqjD/DUF883 family membrane-anchored ribosome-binding protein